MIITERHKLSCTGPFQLLLCRPSNRHCLHRLLALLAVDYCLQFLLNSFFELAVADHAGKSFDEVIIVLYEQLEVLAQLCILHLLVK